MQPENSKTVPLLLTVEQWADLINRDGARLGRCCFDVSAARDGLIEALTLGAGDTPDVDVVEQARWGRLGVDEVAAAVGRLREGARLDAAGAGAVVRAARSHDALRGYFFEAAPPRDGGDPWPAIAAACRELLGDPLGGAA